MGDDCASALARLQEYLDGELDDEAAVGDISRHLAACFPCGDRAAFERHLRVVVRTRCIEQAPEGLVERVRVRIVELDSGS